MTSQGLSLCAVEESVYEYALGWLALFVAMAHMMALTEEEHLRNIHGATYEQYCKRVPRYFGFSR
jgi:protein-S-isoprenylcysteine O-methyltransferase Ste14